MSFDPTGNAHSEPINSLSEPTVNTHSEPVNVHSEPNVNTCFEPNVITRQKRTLNPKLPPFSMLSKLNPFSWGKKPNQELDDQELDFEAVNAMARIPEQQRATAWRMFKNAKNPTEKRDILSILNTSNPPNNQSNDNPNDHRPSSRQPPGPTFSTPSNSGMNRNHNTNTFNHHHDRDREDRNRDRNSDRNHDRNSDRNHDRNSDRNHARTNNDGFKIARQRNPPSFLTKTFPQNACTNHNGDNLLNPPVFDDFFNELTDIMNFPIITDKTTEFKSIADTDNHDMKVIAMLFKVFTLIHADGTTFAQHLYYPMVSEELTLTRRNIARHVTTLERAEQPDTNKIAAFIELLVRFDNWQRGIAHTKGNWIVSKNTFWQLLFALEPWKNSVFKKFNSDINSAAWKAASKLAIEVHRAHRENETRPFCPSIEDACEVMVAAQPELAEIPFFSPHDKKTPKSTKASATTTDSSESSTSPRTTPSKRTRPETPSSPTTRSSARANSGAKKTKSTVKKKGQTNFFEPSAIPQAATPITTNTISAPLNQAAPRRSDHALRRAIIAAFDEELTAIDEHSARSRQTARLPNTDRDSHSHKHPNHDAQYTFHAADITYVVQHIESDVTDSPNRDKLVDSLEQLRELTQYFKINDTCNNASHGYQTDRMKKLLNSIALTTITMKQTECQHNRGQLNRPAFWTLTMTQALNAIILAKFSNKRWLKYKLTYITRHLPHNWLRLYHEDPQSIVYYMFTTSSKMDYVGESGEWRTRFFSEITDARKLGKMMTNNDHPKYQSEISKRKHEYPYSIRAMQRQGHGHWISIPIRNLSRFNDPHNRSASFIRKRVEKYMIQALNPHMNTRGKSYHNIAKKGQRNRPPIAIRKKRKT